MIQPERYGELLERYADGREHKQDFHGVPMYKILYSISTIRAASRYPTASRISEIIGKDPTYCFNMLGTYWKWGYVKKKMIKTATNTTKSADRCSFYWALNAAGKRKLERLREQFGEMVVIDDA